ncbi:MAG: Cof-type HAD-IIB family hydrolase [Erysipelotrichaceae bacterium]
MKYIFLDIDGTLYDSSTNSIPKSALKAIEITRRKGNKVFLATGRSIGESKQHLSLDVDGFILSSGGVIYVNKQRIFTSIISKEEIENLRMLASKFSLGVAVAGDAGSYIDGLSHTYFGKYFGQNLSDGETPDSRLLENGFYSNDYYCEYENCGKVTFSTNKFEDLKNFGKTLDDIYDFKVSLESDELQLYFGDVILKSVSKGEAIKKVLKHLGGSLEDSFAIGDSGNDVDMLKIVKTGVAMGGATAEAKAAANDITKDILDDGLYFAFSKYGLI